MLKYQVIVIGGGHAGVEAAAASARMNVKTLLITQQIESIGAMSCNPSIGGVGKSHLVAEIDALGGLMGNVADKAGIHFRVLNSSKGPAVRSKRAQCDRVLYRNFIQEELNNIENLTIYQQAIESLIVENNRVLGVVGSSGIKFISDSVVLCAGTFLNGIIHIGDKQYSGGRAGEPSIKNFTSVLMDCGITTKRLKTGTPPRIDKRSVDFSKMEIQPSCNPQPAISWKNIGKNSHPKQLKCHIAYTNKNTHKIIKDNLKRSALYGGNIDSVGPRYCPSIEDKIVKFATRDSHQVFVEPEGLTSNELYPNGISTSLPFDVQMDFVRSIEGFENAVITRPAYAIEYDYFDPTLLKRTLESKIISGLFIAGQLNGTTGYEEAGAQGLIAGANAALQIKGEEPWVEMRFNSYMGVMVDDLVTKGVVEPYRMFTSRAEFRLLLREDNADSRLTKKGHDIGLVCDLQLEAFKCKSKEVRKFTKLLAETFVQAGSKESIEFANLEGGRVIKREYSILDLLKRPLITYEQLSKIFPKIETDFYIGEQIEINIKYSGYIDRQNDDLESMLVDEKMSLPKTLNIEKVSGISTEIKSLYNSYKPETLASFARIPGVTPASVAIVRIFIKQHLSSK